MTSDLPLIPISPPTRVTASKSLRIMAHVNLRQAASHQGRNNEFMRRYHAAAAADFEAAAERIENPMYCLTVTPHPIHDPLSTISPV